MSRAVSGKYPIIATPLKFVLLENKVISNDGEYSYGVHTPIKAAPPKFKYKGVEFEVEINFDFEKDKDYLITFSVFLSNKRQRDVMAAAMKAASGKGFDKIGVDSEAFVKDHTDMKRIYISPCPDFPKSKTYVSEFEPCSGKYVFIKYDYTYTEESYGNQLLHGFSKAFTNFFSKHYASKSHIRKKESYPVSREESLYTEHAKEIKTPFYVMIEIDPNASYK